MIARDDDDDEIAAIGDIVVNASTVAIIRDDDAIITVETSASSGGGNIMVFLLGKERDMRDGEFSGGGYATLARCNGKALVLPQDKRIWVFLIILVFIIR